LIIFLLFFFSLFAERSIKYHRWIGYSLAIAMAVHCWGSYITWIKKFGGLNDDFLFEFKKDYIVSGTVGFIAFILIILTSFTIVRRRIFNKVFYPVHILLFLLFTVMSILHHRKLIIFFLPGVVLWIVDRSMRFKDSVISAPLQVAAVTAATQDIARVSLRKRQGMKHTAGQYYFVRSKSVYPMQWHPISVASGPASETLEFLIKGDGAWSKGILGAAGDGTMRVEGPYGIAHGWDTHRTLVFVAGGIGVTPFLGMLEDLAVRRKDTAVERIILVWSVRDAAMAATAEGALRMAQGALGVANVDARIHVSKGAVELSTITIVPTSSVPGADSANDANKRPKLKPRHGEDSTYDSPSQTTTTSTDASPYSNSTYADDGGGARRSTNNAVQSGGNTAAGAIPLRPGRPNIRTIIHEAKSAHGEDIMVLACGPVRMVADAASAAGENSLFFHAETFAF
jgi:NAD(P)H-flavin reductase